MFNNWDNIRTLKYPFHSPNINVYASLDNLIVYDTLTKTQNRRKPFSKGIVAEETFYFPRLTKNWKHNWLIAVSGSVNYENGNNIPTLKNFQKNTSNYSNTDIISLGDYVGKLGDLKNQNSFRGRLLFPMFPNVIGVFKDKNSGKYKDSLQLCLIPYYSFYGKVQTHLSHLVGIYINGSQGQNLFSKNSTIVSGFGIGIDWTATSNGLSDASVFVAGSLDIHAIFEHTKPKSQYGK